MVLNFMRGDNILDLVLFMVFDLLFDFNVNEGFGNFDYNFIEFNLRFKIL